MPITEFETACIDAAMSDFMAKHRRPVEIRDKLDLAYRIEGQSVVIFSIRPFWRDPSETIEGPPPRPPILSLLPSTTPRPTTTPAQILLIPAPPKRRACDMRPLWRDLILKVWPARRSLGEGWGRRPLGMPVLRGQDETRPPDNPSRGNRKTPKACRRFGQEPAQRVTCPAGVKGRGAALNQFFLRLHGLWQGIIHLPRPPPPPFDIDTMEPIEPPWQAVKEWIPDEEPDLDWFNRPRNPSNPDPDGFDQSPVWQPEEVPLGDGRTLVLDDT